MRDFNQARVRLGEFMRQQAENLFQTHGETFLAVRGKGVLDGPVPTTYEQVLREYRSFTQEGRAFRVSADHCANTIYHDPRQNHAFRFWHDVLHAQLRQDFSQQGELAVADVHLAVARAEFGRGSAEVRLLAIDTLGQLEHFAQTGKHVTNQLMFATGMWLGGAYTDTTAKEWHA